jgi:hypothetical protein
MRLKILSITSLTLLLLSGCTQAPGPANQHGFLDQVVVFINEDSCNCEEFEPIVKLAADYNKALTFVTSPNITKLALDLQERFPNHELRSQEYETLSQATNTVYFFDDQGRPYFVIPWQEIKKRPKWFHRFVNGP